jgi:hypothetical protein
MDMHLILLFVGQKIIQKKFIEEHGYPPGWAYDWARNKLEEGTESYVTKIWIPRINKFIEKYGYAPNFAIRWAKDNPEII